jgi:predicted transcriptional regulator
MNYDFQRINFAAAPPPKFVEKRGEDWYTAGKDNRFFEDLLKLYNESPLHNAIVTQKAQFIAGKDTSVQLEGTVSQQAGAMAALQQANPYESWHDLKLKCAIDLENFGGYAVQAIWNAPGTKVVAYYHLPFQLCRTDKWASRIWYCEDWSDRKAEKLQFDAFNPEQPGGTQVFYFKQYRAGEGVYPLPDWYPARTYIEIDTQIPDFHYNNIKNGFAIGKILQVYKGEPTEDVKAEFDYKFKRNTTGTDNAGGILISHSDPNERVMDLIDVSPTDFDKLYLQLSETVRDNIFYAHRVTSPMLFGVRVEGQLGGRNELIEAYELFDKAYSAPKREQINKNFTYLFNSGGNIGELQSVVGSPVTADALELFQKGIMNREEVRLQLGLPEEQIADLGTAKVLVESINSLSPLVANTVLKQLTINEIRSLAGLNPIEGGDALPSDVPAAPTDTEQFYEQNPFGWNDKRDMEVFSRYGSLESDYEELPELFAELTGPEMRIMAVIRDNPQATLEDIAKGARLNTTEAAAVIKDMVKRGEIDWKVGTVNVTEKGLKSINDSGGLKTEIFVLYKYAKAPGISGPVILENSSREFCKFLVEQGKVYTRAEINAMSAELGYDVWKRRGGWRTIKGSSPPLHVPQCRHIWESKLYRRSTR